MSLLDIKSVFSKLDMKKFIFLSSSHSKANPNPFRALRVLYVTIGLTMLELLSLENGHIKRFIWIVRDGLWVLKGNLNRQNTENFNLFTTTLHHHSSFYCTRLLFLSFCLSSLLLQVYNGFKSFYIWKLLFFFFEMSEAKISTFLHHLQNNLLPFISST